MVDYNKKSRKTLEDKIIQKVKTIEKHNQNSALVQIKRVISPSTMLLAIVLGVLIGFVLKQAFLPSETIHVTQIED